MLLLSYVHCAPTLPFIRVAGLSLLKRAVLSAQTAGISRVIVGLPGGALERAQKELASDSRIRAEIEFLGEGNFPFGAGSSIKPSTWDDELIFVRGDRVWNNEALVKLRETLGDTAEIAVLGPPRPQDTWSGMARVKTHAMQALIRADWERPPDLLKALSLTPSQVRFVEMQDAYAPVRPNAPVTEAETMLLKALIKPADGIISRNLNRKISLFLSRRLARTDVHPNQITAIVFLVGIASGPFAFFLGSYWGFFLGGLCYYLSAILDGCDGEISRLKYMGTPLGAWLDTITDDVVCLSYIIGLFSRLVADTQQLFWMITGTIALVFYLLTILPRYYIMAARLGSGDYQKLAAKMRPAEAKRTNRFIQAARDVLFRTDFLPFYAFVTAAVGFVPAFAVPFALGSIGSGIDTLSVLNRTSPTKSQNEVAHNRIEDRHGTTRAKTVER